MPIAKPAASAAVIAAAAAADPDLAAPAAPSLDLGQDALTVLQPALAAVLGSDPKSWIRSRTVWAIGIGVAASVIQRHAGHAATAADQASLLNDALGLVQYGSAALAVVFRILAAKPLK